MRAKISRKEAERFDPIYCSMNDKPILEGKAIAYNSGIYGWNWDLVEYRGKFYVAGYRSFPKTVGVYKSGKK